MGYMKIPNLYKDTRILEFRHCFAMEKLHGTSCHLVWAPSKKTIKYFSGGVKHDDFAGLFNHSELVNLFSNIIGEQGCTVFGEGYGGKCQKMAHTYGELKFAVFDIQINSKWLPVPAMTHLARRMGFDTVPWRYVSTDLEALDYERDRPSVQAIKWGMGEDKLREGIVLRPPFEVKTNRGRLIAKHKGKAFQEREKQPKPKKNQDISQEVLKEADAIAQEWATEMRLDHVLDKLTVDGQQPVIQDTGKVLNAMAEDVRIEAEGEIVWNHTVAKAVKNKARRMFHSRLKKID